MDAEPRALRMVRLPLDTRRLMEMSHRWRVPPRARDDGYLAHCALRGLFGDAAPSPFAVTKRDGRIVQVLGYTDRDLDTLQRHAEAFSDPDYHALCRWDDAADKPLPAAWREGERLGFTVRACPVVRKSSEGDRYKKGAEVDAFLARCWEVGDPSIPVSREDVYADWLREQLERHEGARPEHVQLDKFQRTRLVRRTQGDERKARLPERPDAQLRGTLVVTDGAAFTKLLARGIGRHRAFGFGMLLLTPPERA